MDAGSLESLFIKFRVGGKSRTENYRITLPQGYLVMEAGRQAVKKALKSFSRDFCGLKINCEKWGG